jgi:peroxiredoxin
MDETTPPTGPRLATGGRLPEMALPAAEGGGRLPLNPPGRLTPVLAAVHGAACEECRAWLHRLAAAADELREWDGRVLVIVPGEVDGAARIAADLPFAVAADAEGAFAARTGIGGAGVVIADPWGEVFHVACAGAGHDLPGADEVVEWVRYLAVQCPECQGEAL